MAKGLSGVIIKCDATLKIITGKDELPVTELMKSLWDYIKANNLKKPKE
jgi:chromatin remodeling complex protein RSC6